MRVFLKDEEITACNLQTGATQRQGEGGDVGEKETSIGGMMVHKVEKLGSRIQCRSCCPQGQIVCRSRRKDRQCGCQCREVGKSGRA